MAGIRGIVFDLGGTVVDDGVPATCELAAAVGVDLDTMRQYLQPFKRIRQEPTVLAARVAEDFGCPGCQAQLHSILERRRHLTRHPRLYPDVRQTLTGLRTSGYRIAFLSNLLGAIAPEPESDPLSTLAEATVLSCDVGHVKPDPAAFRAAEQILGLTPTELVHVGDSPGADIVGAQTAGWRAVHVDRSAAVGYDEHDGVPTVSGLVPLLTLFCRRSAVEEAG